MFKIGGVVKLKSGSKKMTITNVGERKGVAHVWTVWMNAAGNEETGFYPADAVEAASDAPPPVDREPPGGGWAGSRRPRS